MVLELMNYGRRINVIQQEVEVNNNVFSITTLTLGSRPRQEVARLWAKREA